MNFPPFWARGTCGDCFSWRWSTTSLADAQALANQAAQQLADSFRHGALPARHKGYYPGRPFREEVLRELRNSSGEIAAVFTRIQQKIEKLLAQGKLRAHPTYFECVTAMAFQYFAEQKVDFAIFEVGLGGSPRSDEALRQ